MGLRKNLLTASVVSMILAQTAHSFCGMQGQQPRQHRQALPKTAALTPSQSNAVAVGYRKSIKLLSSSRGDFGIRKFVASTLIATAILISTPVLVNADELGVETEAPNFFTGESVLICNKRGLLGACLETAVRTKENDNDKAKSYFRDPSVLIKEKELAMRESDSGEGNLLIQKLKQQSSDNREKNDLEVQRKTFENDQSATFGPFDRQVLIMNTDGKTFTLLASPQAMRLKDDGFINNKRQFIKQPTEDDLAAALSAAEEAATSGLTGVIRGFFGGDES